MTLQEESEEQGNQHPSADLENMIKYKQHGHYPDSIVSLSSDRPLG